MAQCGDSVTTDFLTEARETKASVPLHSHGSFSSGVKTTSAFLEPFGTRKWQRAREPLHKENLFQKYKERVEKLQQADRLIKICTDEGFLTTVGVAQYFMTKDTEEFSQSTESVACREYTLPRDGKLSDPKGWSRGNTKIVPVLEVPTCCLQGEYALEIRIESLNKDNSHSWVRISHGLNKLVTDLRNEEDDEEFALKTNVLAFASRSKAKAKPRKTYFCQLVHKNCTYQ